MELLLTMIRPLRVILMLQEFNLWRRKKTPLNLLKIQMFILKFLTRIPTSLPMNGLQLVDLYRAVEIWLSGTPLQWKGLQISVLLFRMEMEIATA